MTTRPRQQGPIGGLAHVIGVEAVIAVVILKVEAHRDRLVAWFAIHGRLDGRVGIVGVDKKPVVMIMRAVGTLTHMEVEPRGIREQFSRAPWPNRVIGFEVSSNIAGGQPRGHVGNNGEFLVVGDIAVATQNPDEAAVAVTLAQEAAIAVSGFGCEDRVGVPARLPPVAAPRRQQTYDQSQFVGARHNGIHMTEVGFVGPGGVLIMQGQIAIGVGDGEALQLSQRHGLNHGKTFGGAIG